MAVAKISGIKSGLVGGTHVESDIADIDGISLPPGFPLAGKLQEYKSSLISAKGASESLATNIETTVNAIVDDLTAKDAEIADLKAKVAELLVKFGTMTSDLQKAKQDAASAQSAASKAQADADKAKQDASKAQAEAASAKQDAANAKTTANNASTKDTTAKKETGNTANTSSAKIPKSSIFMDAAERAANGQAIKYPDPKVNVVDNKTGLDSAIKNTTSASSTTGSTTSTTKK